MTDSRSFQTVTRAGLTVLIHKCLSKIKRIRHHRMCSLIFTLDRALHTEYYIGLTFVWFFFGSNCVGKFHTKSDVGIILTLDHIV